MPTTPFAPLSDDLPVRLQREVPAERQDDAGGDAIVQRRALESLHHGQDDGVHGMQAVAHAFLRIETKLERLHLRAAVGLGNHLIGRDARGGRR